MAAPQHFLGVSDVIPHDLHLNASFFAVAVFMFIPPWLVNNFRLSKLIGPLPIWAMLGVFSAWSS